MKDLGDLFGLSKNSAGYTTARLTWYNPLKPGEKKSFLFC